MAAQKIHEQSQTLVAAVAKLNEAAEALPNDQTLRDAADKIASRSTDLATLAATAQKSAAEPDPSAADAAQTLATAENAVESTLAKHPTVAKFRELEKSQLTAQQNMSDAVYSVSACDAQIATAQSLLDYAALAQSDPLKAAAAWTAIVEKWTIANQVSLRSSPSPPSNSPPCAMRSHRHVRPATRLRASGSSKKHRPTRLKTPLLKRKLVCNPTSINGKLLNATPPALTPIRSPIR